MRHLPSILATVVALIPLGCSESTDDDMEAATVLLGDLDEHLADLRETAQTHDTAVRAATDLSQVTALEQEHAADMDHHLEEMEHTLDELGGCMHDGAAGDTGHMSGLADDVAAEIDAHVEAMGLAGDLAAALAEEDRHAAAMEAFHTSMEEEHAEMMDGMADHMCAAHGEQHDDAQPHHG